MEYKYPPYLLLFNVAEYCPLLTSLYLRLWADSNDENRLMIYFKDIKSQFYCSHVKFRNQLIQLAKEQMVEVKETPIAFDIQLIDLIDDDFKCSA